MFLRPTHEVYDRNFENLFGFGYFCTNFDSRQTIYYPKGADEYNYFAKFDEIEK